MLPQDPLMLAAALSEAMIGVNVEAYRQLTAPDCRVHLNYGLSEAEEIDREEALTGLLRLRAVVQELEYRDVRRLKTPEGFMQFHQVRCITRSGLLLHFDVARIASVRDGRIVSYREYADSAQMRPLRREVT